MDNSYSLADLSAVTNGGGFGGNSFIWFFALLILMNNGMWGNRGDYGQYATAASQQEILFGQKFSDLDNKMDRGFTNVFNGISNLGYTLTQNIKDGNATVAGRVIDEGRALQAQMADHNCSVQRNIDSVRFDMANYTSQIQANDTANTQKILDAIAQNKIETLQEKVRSLELAQATGNVVRYPNAWTYNAGPSPFCGCNACCAN